MRELFKTQDITNILDDPNTLDKGKIKGPTIKLMDPNRTEVKWMDPNRVEVEVQNRIIQLRISIKDKNFIDSIWLNDKRLFFELGKQSFKFEIDQTLDHQESFKDIEIKAKNLAGEENSLGIRLFRSNQSSQIQNKFIAGFTSHKPYVLTKKAVYRTISGNMPSLCRFAAKRDYAVLKLSQTGDIGDDISNKPDKQHSDSITHNCKAGDQQSEYHLPPKERYRILIVPFMYYREGSEKKLHSCSARFRLTDKSLDDLREENIIPGHIIDRLQNLRNQKYNSKGEFLVALRNCIGEEKTNTYQQHILAHAAPHRPLSNVICEKLRAVLVDPNNDLRFQNVNLTDHQAAQIDNLGNRSRFDQHMIINVINEHLGNYLPIDGFVMGQIIENPNENRALETELIYVQIHLYHLKLTNYGPQDKILDTDYQAKAEINFVEDVDDDYAVNVIARIKNEFPSLKGEIISEEKKFFVCNFEANENRQRLKVNMKLVIFQPFQPNDIKLLTEGRIFRLSGTVYAEYIPYSPEESVKIGYTVVTK